MSNFHNKEIAEENSTAIVDVWVVSDKSKYDEIICGVFSNQDEAYKARSSAEWQDIYQRKAIKVGDKYFVLDKQNTDSYELNVHKWRK